MIFAVLILPAGFAFVVLTQREPLPHLWDVSFIGSEWQ